MSNPQDLTELHYVALGKPGDFRLVSAWPPDGVASDDTAAISTAKEADVRLQRTLEQRRLDYFRVIATSRDHSRSLHGWGIECDEETAKDLGTLFSQREVHHCNVMGITKIERISLDGGSRTLLSNPVPSILKSGEFPLRMLGGNLRPCQYRGFLK